MTRRSEFSISGQTSFMPLGRGSCSKGTIRRTAPPDTSARNAPQWEAESGSFTSGHLACMTPKNPPKDLLASGFPSPYDITFLASSSLLTRQILCSKYRQQWKFLPFLHFVTNHNLRRGSGP